MEKTVFHILCYFNLLISISNTWDILSLFSTFKKEYPKKTCFQRQKIFKLKSLYMKEA